jgi:hypothetical protein
MYDYNIAVNRPINGVLNRLEVPRPVVIDMILRRTKSSG